MCIRDRLYVDVCLVHGGQLYGQAAYMAGIDTFCIDHAGNLHACVGRQIVNQACIQYVSANLVRMVGYDCLHNIRSIFPGTFVGYLAVLKDVIPFLLPVRDLLDAASGIFIERNIEPVSYTHLSAR